jgi:hypothetical protein
MDPMRETQHQQRKRRLRKQKPVRRVSAASTAPMPQVAQVTKTARKRRRRNTVRSVRETGASLSAIVLSTRWYSAILLAMCIYALYLIGTNPRYYLTNVAVEGTVALSADEVVTIAELGGKHIFAAKPEQSAELIGALPGVVSVKVTTQWPNQTNIVIEEDLPILSWTENGTTFWVNDLGQFIPSAEVGSPPIRIKAELPEPPMIQPSDEAIEEAEANDEEAPAPVQADTFLSFVSAELMAGVEQMVDLRPDVSLFDYTLAGGLGFQDARGWYAYFGTGDDMVQKDQLYEAIVSELQQQGVTPAYISVGNLEKPYYYGIGGVTANSQ